VLQLVPPPSEGALLASNNLSSIYFREGRYEEALQAAEDCIQSNSEFAPALLNKGKALSKLGRLAEAEAVLSSLAGLQFDPDAGRVNWDFRRRIDDANVFVMLADVQAAEGKFLAAKESYRLAVEQDPANPAVHAARVRALSEWGSTAELISALRIAARESKNKTPFRLQLAWMLSVAANASDRNGQEALALGTELVKELGEENAMALSVLAAAQAEVGAFAEAVATASRARDSARAAGDKPLLERNERQLQAYARREHVYAPPSRAVAPAPAANPSPGRKAAADSASRR
jgi:tetratricopeptide (TPR) repeat protein